MPQSMHELSTKNSPGSFSRSRSAHRAIDERIALAGNSPRSAGKRAAKPGKNSRNAAGMLHRDGAELYLSSVRSTFRRAGRHAGEVPRLVAEALPQLQKAGRTEA